MYNSRRAATVRVSPDQRPHTCRALFISAIMSHTKGLLIARAVFRGCQRLPSPSLKSVGDSVTGLPASMGLRNAGALMHGVAWAVSGAAVWCMLLKRYMRPSDEAVHVHMRSQSLLLHACRRERTAWRGP